MTFFDPDKDTHVGVDPGRRPAGPVKDRPRPTYPKDPPPTPVPPRPDLKDPV